MESPQKYKERQQYAADFKEEIVRMLDSGKTFKKFQKHLELIGPYSTET